MRSPNPVIPERGVTFNGTRIVVAARQRGMQLVRVMREMAEEFLNRNKRNRPLNRHTLWRYCKDLTEGRWRSTAQPIVFDWNGDLMDGQHRLWAIVETGIPMELWVATNEDPDTFPAYDRGRKRSAGDNLAMLGHKNVNILGAAAARLRRHQRGVAWSSTASERYVNIEDQIEAVEEFPGLVDSIAAADRLRVKGIGRLASPSLTGFLHYLFAEKDAELAEWFFEALAGRADLQTTDGAFHLRERLIQNRVSKAQLKEKELAALFIKAWNAHRQAKPVKILRWRASGRNGAEAFPEIL